MIEDLPSAYDPKKVEDKIYQLWEKSGYFNPDNLPTPTAGQVGNRNKAFTIAVPPPNVTGSLHMGHALNATIQDILIRKKRMEGYKTLWIPGTDHAGIATQNVVEKDLKKQGLTRHDLGREKFLEKVWEWKEKYGNIILNQFKKLGSSMDWSRTRFTMDEDYQKSVTEAFNHYNKKGWLYKAERVINWCTKDQTSLSDLELEYKEEKGKLWFIKYPLISEKQKVKSEKDFIVVATTRPETMLGDSAVAVNPKDERYKNLVGKKVLLPIQNREIPIIADEEIEMEFGTGAVKVTPAHDLLDARIGEKHKLPIYKVIGPLGKMTDEAGQLYAGLKIKDCREKVAEELKNQNLIEKEEDYTHNVAVCYRCGTVIEPLPSLQWFLKMDELAKLAIKAVKNGEVKFHPATWEKVYLDWLENIRDWNISRQIWWGHKIPLEGVDDVLDTWFSSALWPLAILGWPKKTKEMKKFYPVSLISSAREIFFLWIIRMIFSGLEFTGSTPFHTVYTHATILDAKGRKMSKSIGNVVDPINMIEKYSVDALRFGLVWQTSGTQDIHWNESALMAGKKFLNKVWNASHFVLTQNEITNNPAFAEASAGRQDTITKQILNRNLTKHDEQILKELEKIIKATNNRLEKYEFGQALHGLYDFFWHQFCDVYLEAAKKKAGPETPAVLLHILATSLKLLHPFLPFITEHIWETLPLKNKKLLLIEEWPS